MQDSATINSFIRSSGFLAPGDSTFRAIEMLRDTTLESLPVLDGYGRLIGIVSLRDLAPLLRERDGSERALLRPVAEWMREPGAVAAADITPKHARQVLAESGEPSLPIVDAAGRFVGVITLPDLLIPDPTPPRPPSIGGMATPWGVYLTNGSIQAGVGNLALLGSGAMLGVLMAVSYAGVGLAAWAVQRTAGIPLYKLWLADAPAQITLSNLGWFALQGLSLPLFLLLMRAMPLAGYHAAEHQVVHAMERNEPLQAEVVSRMPRVHPRCGTNLMAAVLVFALVSKLLSALHIGLGATDSAMIGALAALFTWRSVGAALQHYFTTRPPSPAQIDAGIAAAKDLDRKYLTTVLRQPSIARRLWCMGLPQMALGSIAGTAALSFLFDLLSPHLK